MAKKTYVDTSRKFPALPNLRCAVMRITTAYMASICSETCCKRVQGCVRVLYVETRVLRSLVPIIFVGAGQKIRGPENEAKRQS